MMGNRDSRFTPHHAGNNNTDSKSNSDSGHSAVTDGGAATQVNNSSNENESESESQTQERVETRLIAFLRHVAGSDAFSQEEMKIAGSAFEETMVTLGKEENIPEKAMVAAMYAIILRSEEAFRE
jgi:hypothetical protein